MYRNWKVAEVPQREKMKIPISIYIGLFRDNIALECSRLAYIYSNKVGQDEVFTHP